MNSKSVLIRGFSYFPFKIEITIVERSLKLEFKTYNSPVFMLNNLNSTTIINDKFYNPIIGSNLGIPLNLLQFFYTYNHYQENIIDYNLILFSVELLSLKIFSL